MTSDSVLSHFKKITEIPRESGHEEPMTAYLQSFAASHGLACKTDATGNVLITKEAAPGKENVPTIVLQGHQDMVCEKNAGVQHDFSKDPIRYVVEDGWMIAKDTTLGADDGIGIAASLALLESDLPMGKIECLFTISEETGMDGAEALEQGFFTGKTLINLDSEEEGEFCIGCAGGLDGVITMNYRNTAVPAGMKGYQIVITGLNGGHSGMDINLGRANANKLMTRVLSTAAEKCGIRLASFVGGNLRNAIPREAVAIVAVPEANEKALTKLVIAFAKTAKAEFSATEPNMTIKAKAIDTPAKVMPEAIQEKLLGMVFALPNGVLRMSFYDAGGMKYAAVDRRWVYVRFYMNGKALSDYPEEFQIVLKRILENIVISSYRRKNS